MAKPLTYQTTLVADVGSGTLRASDGLAVDGTPTIVAVDPSATTVGHVWQLDDAQALKFKWNLPDTASVAQVTIFLAGLQGPPASAALRINGGPTVTYPSPDEKKVKAQPVALGGVAFTPGSDTLEVGSAAGRIGIQAVRVVIGLPYPRTTFGSQESPAYLTLLEPLPTGATVGEGRPITFRWKAENAPPGTFVNLSYQPVNGRWLPVPGGTTLPYNVPDGLGDEGVYSAVLPTGIGDVQVAAEPFVLDLPAQESVLLQLPTPESSTQEGTGQVTPDFRYALIVDRGNPVSVNVWDTRSGTIARSLTGPENVNMDGLLVSPDSKYALVHYGVKALLWSIETGELVKSYDLPDGVLCCYMPDGRSVLLDNFKKIVALNLDDGTHRDVYTAGEGAGPPIYLGVSADGSRALVNTRTAATPSTPATNDVALVDVQSGTEVWRRANVDLGNGAFFSRDGRFLLADARPGGSGVTGSYRLVLFDAATGGEVVAYPAPGTGIPNATPWSWHFLPDGQRVVTLDSPGNDKFFIRNLLDGAILGSVAVPGGPDEAVLPMIGQDDVFLITPDGKSLVFFVGSSPLHGGIAPKLTVLPLPAAGT